MSGNKYSIEVHRRIYDDENGQYITVAPDADSLWLVEIRADESQQGYWGVFCLTIPKVGARKLAQAIIALADDLDAEE